jgi:acyl-CoA hydrolase
MPPVLSLSAALGRLAPGQTVYVPGACGETAALVAALRATPDAAAGITFCGVWLPGVNRIDYAALHPTARSIAFFVAPEFRDSFAQEHLTLHPLAYSAIPPWLVARGLDVAFLHLSPPDAAGRCSVGIAADFTATAFAAAKTRIGLINRAMPTTRGHTIAYGDLDAVVEIDVPLLELTTGAADDPQTATLAAHVAAWVRDGDTVQIGLGNLPTVILHGLRDRRNLRFHSGMVAGPVADLLDAGAIAADGDAIVTGVAFGDQAFYRRIAAEDRVRFAPVTETHRFAVLAAIPNFIAINSALSVDLFGQCNTEMIGPRQISGSGGVTDFIRGAQASSGGRAIIALPATAKDGTLSRIVATHADGSVISNPRVDAPIVVTEYGSADLRGTDIATRAKALIAIAAPQFRDELDAAWVQMRKRM